MHVCERHHVTDLEESWGNLLTFCRVHGGHSVLLFQGKSCALPSAATCSMTSSSWAVHPLASPCLPVSSSQHR